jgi:hypothetical protein
VISHVILAAFQGQHVQAVEEIALTSIFMTTFATQTVQQGITAAQVMSANHVALNVNNVTHLLVSVLSVPIH